MPITPEQYTQKRNELVSILDSTVSELKNLPSNFPELRTLNEEMGTTSRDVQDSCVELSQISRQVREDTYRIQLLSRFQGGKSTTADTLADGQILSPLGNSAVRCSAVVVKIQNVVDDRDVGAVVRLRCVEELQAFCESVVGEVDFNDRKKIREKVDEIREFGRSARDAELTQAMKQLQQLDQTENGNCRLSDNEIREIIARKMDELQVASLILHFYHDPVVECLRQRAGKTLELNLDIDEASRFAPAPNDYFVRFGECDPAKFQANEVLFPFVREILFRTKSSELESIGAAITDTPGLFANKYDTFVTKAELKLSNAVWFLVPQAMQLTESEREQIQLLLGSGSDPDGSGENIFLSVNIQNNRVAKDSSAFKDTILGTIRENFRSAGIADPKVYPYHALLALLAAQGEKALQNRLHPREEQWLRQTVAVRDADKKTVVELWKIAVRRSLTALYLHDDDNPHPVVVEFKEADQRNDVVAMVEIARHESGFDDILHAIKNFVINNQAESILIARGAKRAENAIQFNLAQPLESLQESAERRVEETIASLNKSKATLDKFMKEAESILAPIKGGGDVAVMIDRGFVRDVYEYAFEGAVNGIAKNAAPLIRNETGIFETAVNAMKQGWHMVKSIGKWLSGSPPSRAPENLQDKCQKIIEKTAEKVIGETLVDWLDEVRYIRRDSAKTLFREIDNLQNRIQSKWDIICSGDTELEDLWDVTQFSDEFDRSARISFDANLSEIMKSVRGHEIGAFFFSAAVGFGWFVILSPIPLGWIAAAIITFINTVLVYSEAELIRKIEEKLLPSLNEHFRKNKEEMIRKILSGGRFSRIRQSLVHEILEEPLQTVQTRFNNNYTNEMRIANAAAEMRKQVAELCRKMREKSINPLLRKITDYIRTTRDLLK